MITNLNVCTPNLFLNTKIILFLLQGSPQFLRISMPLLDTVGPKEKEKFAGCTCWFDINSREGNDLTTKVSICMWDPFNNTHFPYLHQLAQNPCILGIYPVFQGIGKDFLLSSRCYPCWTGLDHLFQQSNDRTNIMNFNGPTNAPDITALGFLTSLKFREL